MCLTVSCSPGEPLHPADCCPPVMDSRMDWLMPTPSLHCRQATAGVGWQWFEPVVQPQLQLWGAWPGSQVVCLLHGPPYYVKSQTQNPMKCWTAGLSSGSQVCFLLRHTLHIFLYSKTYLCIFKLRCWCTVIFFFFFLNRWMFIVWQKILNIVNQYWKLGL